MPDLPKFNTFFPVFFSTIFAKILLTSTPVPSAKLSPIKIIDLYYEFREHCVLESGDILILNNHKVVHGRSAFSPLFNGHDRFVIRSFIMKNINKLNGKTGGHSRMVAKEFS